MLARQQGLSTYASMSTGMMSHIGSTVAKHFNLRGHSMKDLTIRVIEQDDDDETLKTLKKRWIKT